MLSLVFVVVALVGVSFQPLTDWRVTLSSHDLRLYFAVREDDQFWIWIGAPLYVVLIAICTAAVASVALAKLSSPASDPQTTDNGL